MSNPRVLFVSRTRYRLPLDEPLARKWDGLGEELDLRVLASAAGGDPVDDGRFNLVASGSAAFYGLLPLRIARELRSFRPDVIVTQSPYEAVGALLGRRISGSRARVLLEVHGDWDTATRLYGSHLRRLLEPVSRRASRAAVRRADAVRTVSPFTSELVRAVGVEPAATFTTYFDVSAFDESDAASGFEDSSLSEPARLRLFSLSPLKSVSYQPPPLRRKFGAETSFFRASLPHEGHLISGVSLIFCITSV